MNSEEICQMATWQDEVGEHCVTGVVSLAMTEEGSDVHFEAFQVRLGLPCPPSCVTVYTNASHAVMWCAVSGRVDSCCVLDLWYVCGVVAWGGLGWVVLHSAVLPCVAVPVQHRCPSRTYLLHVWISMMHHALATWILASLQRYLKNSIPDVLTHQDVACLQGHNQACHFAAAMCMPYTPLCNFFC